MAERGERPISTGDRLARRRWPRVVGAFALSAAGALSSLSCSVNVTPQTTIEACGGLADFTQAGDAASLSDPQAYRASIVRDAAIVRSRIMAAGGTAALPDLQDVGRVDEQDTRPSVYMVTATTDSLTIGAPSAAFISSMLKARKWDTITISFTDGQADLALGAVACTGVDERIHPTGTAVALSFLAGPSAYRVA